MISEAPHFRPPGDNQSRTLKLAQPMLKHLRRMQYRDCPSEWGMQRALCFMLCALCFGLWALCFAGTLGACVRRSPSLVWCGGAGGGGGERGLPCRTVRLASSGPVLWRSHSWGMRATHRLASFVRTVTVKHHCWCCPRASRLFLPREEKTGT